MPPIISWGRRADGTIITVDSSTIIKAYDEITQWRKNTFLVPYGKVGREFIDQLTQHITESDAIVVFILIKLAEVMIYTFLACVPTGANILSFIKPLRTGTT